MLRTPQTRSFDTLRAVQVCPFCLADDPTDRLAVTGQTNTLPTARISQDISEIVAGLGNGNWQTLHTESVSKSDAKRPDASGVVWLLGR